MAAVISDASVLICLGAVGQLDLLREFYSEILVPPAVWSEVTSAGTRPGAAEAQAARTAGWLRFRSPTNSSLLASLTLSLDAGEAEAIALATELPGSLLLLDDGDARETALQMKLDFTGTLGVLLRAKHAGKLLALKPALDRLVRQHSFRVSQRLYEQALREAGEPS
ncbi:MAG: DUF3368 domain-containing protein [Verrucomicrobiae bacterium]|nr:DUF3368 domain-containing protein [Verrucomicrobiae bacterium]